MSFKADENGMCICGCGYHKDEKPQYDSRLIIHAMREYPKTMEALARK